MADPLAVYGAIIGTAAAAGAVWNIYSSITRNRVRLKVRASVRPRSLPLVFIGPGSSSDRPMYNYLMITIVNVGQKLVKVDGVGIICRSGSDRPLPSSPRLPAELTPGQSCEVEVPVENVERAVESEVPKSIYCRDVEGNVHTGHLSLAPREKR